MFHPVASRSLISTVTGDVRRSWKELALTDIAYKLNDPGMSAVWCVVPAVKAAIATGIDTGERFVFLVEGEVEGEVEILFDQHDGHLAPVAQKPDHAPDLLDDVGLDTLGRFVQQEQLRDFARRMLDQGVANADTALAMGRLVARLEHGLDALTGLRTPAQDREQLAVGDGGAQLLGHAPAELEAADAQHHAFDAFVEAGLLELGEQ